MSTAQAGQPRSSPDQAPPFTSSLAAFNLRAEIAHHNQLASEAVANAREALQATPQHPPWSPALRANAFAREPPPFDSHNGKLRRRT